VDYRTSANVFGVVEHAVAFWRPDVVVGRNLELVPARPANEDPFPWHARRA
jgi:hypothetical protein